MSEYFIKVQEKKNWVVRLVIALVLSYLYFDLFFKFIVAYTKPLMTFMQAFHDFAFILFIVVPLIIFVYYIWYCTMALVLKCNREVSIDFNNQRIKADGNEYTYNCVSCGSGKDALLCPFIFHLENDEKIYCLSYSLYKMISKIQKCEKKNIGWLSFVPFVISLPILIPLFKSYSLIINFLYLMNQQL